MSGSTTTTKPLAGYRLANTNVGDTIQEIALRELGDASRWYDLVAINGLLPPYVVDDLEDASATVILAGQQVIKIPSSSPPASGVADQGSVFGTDISLTGGRLDVTPGGDLLTISGPDNLAQALRNRLVTPKRELTYHPDYGCDVYKLKGQGASESTNALAAIMVSRAVRADPRVSSVEGAQGLVQGDQITAICTAVTVDGKRVPTGIPSGQATTTTLP